MIQLSSASAAQAALAIRSAIPPTHAQMVSLAIHYDPTTDTTHSISADFQVGTLDGGGVFVPLSTGAILFNLNQAHLQTTALAADERTRRLTMMKNVVASGVSPDPTDPTKTMHTPSKKAGDCKRADVEILAALLDPRLQGTIV